MSVGLNFGSATSGTGFDVTTTVSSIMALQRAPETAWATRNTALTAQDAVLSTLGTDMSALATSLSSLTTFDGVFSNMTGATSDSSTVALTNVGSTAVAGTHTLTVAAIAKTSKDYSSAVASSATLSGTLNLTVGSGTTTAINISTGSTLKQVAAQINASSAGVTASILNGNNGSYLSLVSNTSGASGELTIDSSTVKDSSNNTLSFTELQAGVDAAYTLDGVSFTSPSNTVSTALTGVTFQLLAPTGTTTSSSGTTTGNSVLMEIEPDTSSVSTTLSSFVTAYNALAKALTAQEAKDSTGTALPLYGSPLISQIQGGLASALSIVGSTSASTSSTAVSLVSLGITMGTDGTLTLNTSTLTSALSSNLTGVVSFFQDANKFGQTLTKTLTNLGSSSTGAIGLATTANSTEETQLATNKTNLELRLATYESNLTTELNTANEILQAIPTTLKGITALFDAITGNTSS